MNIKNLLKNKHAHIRLEKKNSAKASITEILMHENEA